MYSIYLRMSINEYAHGFKLFKFGFSDRKLNYDKMNRYSKKYEIDTEYLFVSPKIFTKDETENFGDIVVKFLKSVETTRPDIVNGDVEERGWLLVNDLYFTEIIGCVVEMYSCSLYIDIKNKRFNEMVEEIRKDLFEDLSKGLVYIKRNNDVVLRKIISVIF